MTNLLRAASVLALSAAALSVSAQVELITNGNFSSTFSTGTQSAGTPSQLRFNGYGVTNWDLAASPGYTFLWNPTLAGSGAYTSNGQYGDVQLYTSANGGSATAPANYASPVGGNFIGQIGSFQAAAVQQVVNNLTVGAQYDLSFYWAGAAQAGFVGTSQHSWGVTFGAQSFSTPAVIAPPRGFAPWMRATYRFTATSDSQRLSFLSSTPLVDTYASPFTLLDGVSLVQAVPEPSTWAALGLGGLAFLRRRKRA